MYRRHFDGAVQTLICYDIPEHYAIKSGLVASFWGDFRGRNEGHFVGQGQVARVQERLKEPLSLKAKLLIVTLIFVIVGGGGFVSYKFYDFTRTIQVLRRMPPDAGGLRQLGRGASTKSSIATIAII